MNRNYSYLHRLLLLLVLAVFTLFIGCGDDKSGSTTEPGTVERLFSYPEIRGCGPACHEPDGTQEGGPDLRTPQSFYRDLVSKDNSNFLNWIRTTVDCGDTYKYIEPKKPVTSAALMGISQVYDDSLCTSALSFHEPANAVLSSDALEDMLLWIEKGALPPAQ